MRRNLTLLPLLFLCFLAGCGVSPRSVPQSFILSTESGVAFLTWKDVSGQISGQYFVATNQGVQGPLPLSGQRLNATASTVRVTLAIQGTGLNGLVAGATLRTTDGEGHALLWYAGTFQQYQQVETAYRFSIHVKIDLTMLQQVQTTPPEDSDPDYFQAFLQGARDHVGNEQKSLSYITSQRDPFTLCSAIAEFSLNFPAPTIDPELQVPFAQPGDTSYEAVIDRSRLVQSMMALMRDSQQAERLPLPAIKGLPLAWKVNPALALQQAQVQKARLQESVFDVASRLSPLRDQARHIQEQVQAEKQAHACFSS